MLRTLTGAVLVATLLLLAGAATAAEPPRVAEARKRKLAAVEAAFRDKGLAYPPGALFLRAFKREGVLELWGRDPGHAAFTLVKAYPICASSGELGPKRREGDGQVPEGAYRVVVFNPASRFHLSLGLDYPNASDRVLSDRRRPGGAIMVHGNCVTIGCIPIEDDGIEEVYLAALDARDRTVPVHVFPGRMDPVAWPALLALARERGDAELRAFWENLKRLHDTFEVTRRLPGFTVGKDGRYRVRPRTGLDPDAGASR